MNQIRIIAGKWRGRKLIFPNIADLRPTADRVRETVFNWLMHDIVETRCLDLFAGSGALGFEALSRGAKEVIFVDQSKKVIDQIKENIKQLNLEKETTLIQSSAEAVLNQATEPFDIIFLDPPYRLNNLAHLCEIIVKKKLLTDIGIIYFEMSARDMRSFNLPNTLTIKKQKKAGRIVFGLI